ncbi:MAG: hypothetical protein AAF533_14890 [Acidobacteriota bacterium]
MFSCPTTGTWVNGCPSKGRIEVADYDLAGDGVIDSTDLQCAIDCLDGDIAPEWILTAADGPYVNSERSERGGELIFDPSLSYVIDGTVNLPTLIFQAPLVIRGNGAKLVADSGLSGVMFRRVVPIGGNNCDAAWMGNNGTGWRIQDLSFVGHGGANLPSGMILDGLNNAVIDNCRFIGLSRGLVLRYVLTSQVSQCDFVNCLKTGLLVGNRTSATELWPGFDRCETGFAPVFGIPTGQNVVTLGGCNGTMLLHNHYFGHPDGSEALVYIHDAYNAFIQGSIYEGVLPKHAIYAESAAGISFGFQIRNVSFELGQAPGSYDPTSDVSLIRLNTWGSALSIDGLHVEGGHHTVLDMRGASSGAASHVSMKNVHWFPSSLKIRFGNASDQFTFENFRHIVDVPGRWIDAAGSLSASPTFVTEHRPADTRFYSAAAFKLEGDRMEAVELLTLPDSGFTVAPPNRTIWIDPVSNELRYRSSGTTYRVVGVP